MHVTSDRGDADRGLTLFSYMSQADWKVQEITLSMLNLFQYLWDQTSWVLGKWIMSSDHTPSDDNSSTSTEVGTNDAKRLQNVFRVTLQAKKQKPEFHPRRSHKKSRAGCSTCKKRRVKVCAMNNYGDLILNLKYWSEFSVMNKSRNVWNARRRGLHVATHQKKIIQRIQILRAEESPKWFRLRLCSRSRLTISPETFSRPWTWISTGSLLHFWIRIRRIPWAQSHFTISWGVQPPP